MKIHSAFLVLIYVWNEDGQSYFNGGEKNSEYVRNLLFSDGDSE
jgi:hypothetical protein